MPRSLDTSTLAEDFAVLYRHCDYPVPPDGLRIEVADNARDAASRIRAEDLSESCLVRFAPARLLDADPLIPSDDADMYRAIERIQRAGVRDSIWCVEGVIVLTNPHFSED